MSEQAGSEWREGQQLYEQQELFEVPSHAGSGQAPYGREYDGAWGEHDQLGTDGRIEVKRQIDHDASWSLRLALVSFPLLLVFGTGVLTAAVSLLLARSANRIIRESGGGAHAYARTQAAVRLDGAVFGLFVLVILFAVFERPIMNVLGSA